MDIRNSFRHIAESLKTAFRPKSSGMTATSGIQESQETEEAAEVSGGEETSPSGEGRASGQEPQKPVEASQVSGVQEEQGASSARTRSEACEKEAEEIVKSILKKVVSPERIISRSSLIYFAIFIDNNRKTVCRLYLSNPENKRLALLDENRKEVRTRLESLEDLYRYSDKLQEAAMKYLQNG